MTRVSGDWLTRRETQAVFDALGEAWFVGGAVRNALLGEPVTDIDITTPLAPETVMEKAARAGLHAVPTGIDHGTVTVVSGGLPHEVTTLRHDVETDGRRAVVAFASDIEDDAARRDFTVNALYADRAGEVRDPLGQGLADIRDRRVRFIGDARERIREDYLRILRYFRFLARLSPPDGPDPEALAAIGSEIDGLDGLSRERVGHEMLRLMAAADPAPAVAAMNAAGVLARVLPGAEPRALAPLVHLEAGMPPDPLRRMAALGGESPGRRLRLSKADSAGIETIRRHALEGTAPAAVAWKEGPEIARDSTLVRAAMTGEALPDDLEAEIARGGAAVFPVKAADLMPGLEGAALGARLRDLEARWIASGLRATKRELLEG